MYLLMSYPVGVTMEAVILAKGRNRMRVVVAGLPDTVELKRSGAAWMADGEPVQFDFLMASVTQNARVSRSVRPGATRKAAG
jgi:hypothetical protein